MEAMVTKDTEAMVTKDTEGTKTKDTDTADTIRGTADITKDTAVTVVDIKSRERYYNCYSYYS